MHKSVHPVCNAFRSDGILFLRDIINVFPVISKTLMLVFSQVLFQLDLWNVAQCYAFELDRFFVSLVWMTIKMGKGHFRVKKERKKERKKIKLYFCFVTPSPQIGEIINCLSSMQKTWKCWNGIVRTKSFRQFLTSVFSLSIKMQVHKLVNISPCSHRFHSLGEKNPYE